MEHINYLAVLAAAVSTFVIGGLWYSPVMFQRGWIARVRSSRIVRVTAKGREDVYKLLKLTL